MPDPKDDKVYKNIAELEKFLDRSKGKMREALTKLREGLSKESDETKEMLEIYYKWTNGKATDEDLHKANEQFADLIRAMGLGIFLILPAAPITIPFFVKLGKMVGVDLLPSAFRGNAENVDNKDSSPND